MDLMGLVQQTIAQARSQEGLADMAGHRDRRGREYAGDEEHHEAQRPEGEPHAARLVVAERGRVRQRVANVRIAVVVQ